MATAGRRVAARAPAPVPVPVPEGGLGDPARPPSMVPAWARDSPTNRAFHVVPMSGPASIRPGLAARPTEATGRAARDSASRPDPTRPIDRARTDPASAASTGRGRGTGGGRARPGHVPAGPDAEPAPAPTSDRAIVRPPARTRARTWSKASRATGPAGRIAIDRRTPGPTAPGQPSLGPTALGRAGPGPMAPGRPSPAQPSPGHTAPGRAGLAQPSPGPTAPGRAGPIETVLPARTGTVLRPPVRSGLP